MKLYFAYGSNMCQEQMNKTCPDHHYFGTGILKGFRWIISTRGYANIIKSEGDEVYGVVYKMSAADELSVEEYEGIRNASYQKEMMDVKVDKTTYRCLVYIDPNVEEGIPTGEYINLINQAVEDAELSQEYVERYIRKYLSCQ
jgi:cation transport regulator ChaC